MSTHRISFDTPVTGQTVTDTINAQADNAESFIRLTDFINGITSGERSGKIRFNVNAVQASGTVAFASFADADTVTLNGVVLTGKTSPSGTQQWAVGSSDEACRNNFVAKVNASALDLIVGVLAASSRGTVLLSSFVNADTITVNNIVFTGKTSPNENTPEEFKIGSTDALTAQNLLNCIASSVRPELDGVAVTRSSATLTFNYLGSLTLAASAHATVTDKTAVIVSIIPGQIGNLCSLAISAHGSVSGALLTGGTEGTETIIDRNYISY